jgi:ABC-2 type transport system ATP-binding protein
MSQALLNVRQLAKTYSGADQPALDGLDLRIAGGEILGLLGPNGAGKTTAVSILCGLLRPDSGTVTIGGEDALRRPARVRSLIGLVPQEIALYPTLSARENLVFFGRMYGLTGALLQRRVAEGLELVGLTEHGGKPLASYSGGMKRRANLAAGILHRPRLLFLDEPTVGIDPQSRNMILEQLEALRAEGMAMLYTTHYLQEAAQLCSRVMVIDHGRLLVEGEPAALVAAHPGCTSLEGLFLALTGRQLRD